MITRCCLAVVLLAIAVPAVAQEAPPPADFPVLAAPFDALDVIRTAQVGAFAPNVAPPVRVQPLAVPPYPQEHARNQQVRPPRPLLPAYHSHQNRHHHRGDHRGHR